MWGLGGGAGGAFPGWLGHQHHCLSSTVSLTVRGREEASAGEAGELELLGLRTSVETRVTVPEAHPGMEIAQVPRPSTLDGKDDRT